MLSHLLGRTYPVKSKRWAFLNKLSKGNIVLKGTPFGVFDLSTAEQKLLN
jgi:hypothetical protein